MKLKKLKLQNFRQFYGEQEILLSCDPARNITLIHAENGVGKTTLLNALTWCFYEKLTLRFENQDQITNHEAVKQGNNITSVEITLEYKGEEYKVTRRKNESADKKGTFKAFKVTHGNHEEVRLPNILIEEVIPQEMSGYFFFDGEYAEALSGSRNKKEVREALENMLGCKVANQAISDLQYVAKNIEMEIGKLSQQNVKANLFQEQIDRYNELLEENDDVISNLEKAFNANKDAIAKIENSLRNAKEAQDIQKKIDMHSSEVEKLHIKHSEYTDNLTEWLGQKSAGAVGSRAVEKSIAVISQANTSGKLPSDVAENFVENILDSLKCICGREFKKNSTEESLIKELLDKAANADMYARVSGINQLIGELEASKSASYYSYKKIKAQISKIEREISHHEGKIQDFKAILGSSNIKEISRMQSKVDKLSEENNEILTEKGMKQQNRIELEGDLKKALQQRDKFLPDSDDKRILTQKSLIVNETIRSLRQKLENYREEARLAVTEKVNNILSQTTRRGYNAKIDENFNLGMFYLDTEISVGKSSGENQLLSLAFISALISFSSERQKLEHELLKPGTMAPLMLDSPFGQLDPSYRISTAGFLPELADQVILLVSKTQGDDDVIRALGDSIGNEYVLVSQAVGPQGNKPSDEIELYGKKYQCAEYDCEFNQTVIRKVEK